MRSVWAWLAACVMLMAAPLASACSTVSWTGGLVGVANAEGPETVSTAPRYSGRCALAAGASSIGYVTADFFSLESQVRARFYVFTNVTGANPVVMRATGGGTTYIDVAYQPGSENFAFTVGGSTLTTAAGSAPRGRWIGVEISYSSGSAFSATTSYRGVSTNLAAGLTAPNASIDKMSIGVIAGAGGSGIMYFDAFEARRSTPSGFLCPGDANSSGLLELSDVDDIMSERVHNFLANGTPDCTHDGKVDVFDAVCSNRRRVVTGSCSGLARSKRGFDLLFADGFE